MFLTCFIFFIVTLIMKSGSNTIGENRCDLSRRCMKDFHSIPAMKSTMLKCIKKSSCPALDNNFSCSANQANKISIHLKDIRIKQNKNSQWIQIMLSSYELVKQGNKSLIVKFLFEEDRACYEFLIPSSILKNSKDILLPCFRTQIMHRSHLMFYLSVHEKTDEVTSIQGMKYSLSNITDGQWLRGNVIRPIFDFDDEFVFFSVNATQDLKCSYDYDIAVRKSDQYHVCSIKEIPVYYMSSVLNSSYHKLNVGRSFFSPCQKYCIYTVFKQNEECGVLHPKIFIDIAFFQLPPVETNKFYTEIPTNDCDEWNLTIDYKVIEKNVIVTIELWSDYVSCFSSYLMFLYQLKSPICDPDLGHPTPGTLSFKARPNNKSAIRVFKNVSIGYYCILIVPFFNQTGFDELTRDSGSFHISEIAIGNNTELNEKDKSPEFATKVIVAISFLVFFTAFSLWSFSNYIRKSKKANTNKEFPNENVREKVPLLTLVVDEVYLFYSREDHSISREVSLLKSFLKEKAHFNVLTLSDVLPETLDHPDLYLSELLECKCTGKGPFCASNKKFIIVISEKVLCGIDADWLYCEERAFRKVLHRFTNDDERKAYCHLFLVAFKESICVDDRFEKIAPKNISGVTFVIPNHLINLCMKLGSSASREELQMCLEHYDIRNVESK